MTEKWTAKDVPSLSGQVVVLTGANSGIGYEAAKVVASRGARTILACRSEMRGEEAAEAIREEHRGADVSAMKLDLGSLRSIRGFSEALLERVERIDGLVNNAGIMMPPYGETEDGFEQQLGVNHLGHFALTGLLLPALLAAPRARVVNVASLAHQWGTMDFDDLMFEGGRGYSPAKAYGRSKLANLLFTHALERRFREAGTKGVALAAHPGASATNLARHLAERWYLRPFVPLGMALLQSAAMGSLPTLRALTDPNARGGEYYGPRGFREQRGYPVKVGSSAESRDPEVAERLWRASEELTGVRYDFAGSAS